MQFQVSSGNCAVYSVQFDYCWILQGTTGFNRAIKETAGYWRVLQGTTGYWGTARYWLVLEGTEWCYGVMKDIAGHCGILRGNFGY